MQLKDLEIGRIVKLKVNNKLNDFIVVCQGNPDSKVYDNSFNDGTWLLMKNCYTKMAFADNVNNNVYSMSLIHKYLNNDFLNLFDNDIKKVVKEAKIPYSPGASTCLIYDGNKGLSCKCFILSGTEINLDVGNYNKMLPKEGILLPYFKDENVNRDYGCNNQWTRSRVCGSDDHRFTWEMSWGGNGHYTDFNLNFSIRPCLVLPNNLNFLSETSTVYFPKYILCDRK